jgi:phospholipid/cholesterol/gamma-HCH transport system substrate-binding protein
MDERVVQFRVGVMVIASIVISVVLVALFGELPQFVQRGYTVNVRFSSAPGVAPDTPVRSRGLLIGRVTAVKLADDNSYVLVTVRIDSDIKLQRNSTCRIVRSVLGDTVIEFEPRPPELPRPQAAVGKLQVQTVQLKQDQFLQEGDTIEGSVRPDPLESVTSIEGDLRETIDSIGKASVEVQELARRLNVVLTNNEEQIGRIVGKTEAALDQFETAMTGVNDVLGDPQLRDSLKNGLRQLPAAIVDIRQGVADMRAVLQLADTNLRHIEGFTRPLGQKGPQLVDNLDRTVARLDALFSQFVEFGKKLNTGEGTIGKLLTDPTLYNNANQVVCNIREMTVRLRPILDDVRVITDKLARHPERVGVKGALQNSPGIK